jgi:2-aminoadipate transaminase
MDNSFADRISDVPRSFIREILKVALDSTVISFAGGLPNRDLFPADEIKAATEKVFEIYGRDIFQYSNSEGMLSLREYIADRYYQKLQIKIPVEDILITSGSQQGLDLIGKIFLNDGDGLVIEEPGYLGAIQAFSIYKPTFFPVPVSENGMDAKKLRAIVTNESPKLIYSVPNFSNPSGVTYPDENRDEISRALHGARTILIEDDPYGDLRFTGEPKQSFKLLAPANTIMLGSFSKTIVPGFRLGWIVASKPIMEKLIVAKQAADLHTCHFTQSIIFQYLKDNEIELHIDKIKDAYGRQCRAMLRAIKDYFPKDVKHTTPEGGMFLWAELPENLTALDLFNAAVKENVIFVPGDPFYIGKKKTRTMRLNFSCVDEETIRAGIEKLGSVIKKLLTQT